jgi:acetylornithine deacetylase/succinyl-diaminopimelate desuccinylase-like protein
VTAAQIVTNLQSVVCRQVDLSQGAAVVTVGQFNSGNRGNIIPEDATLAGTIRTLNERSRTQVNESVARMARGTAEASGLLAEVKIDRGYPVLSNNPELVTKVLGARLFLVLESTAPRRQGRRAQPFAAVHDWRKTHEDRCQGTGQCGAGLSARRQIDAILLIAVYVYSTRAGCRFSPKNSSRTR